MPSWWAKLLCLFGRRRGLDRELTSELEAHLQLLIDDHVASGMQPDEAQIKARRDLGNRTLIQEQARDSWRSPHLETLLQDVRHTLRSMARAPGFSAAVTLTLALGIGVNTAVFSVVYAILLRPLPYPAGERLVQLGESSGSASGISVSWINYQHWRTENRSFDDVAAFATADLTLTGRGDARLLHAGTVSHSFFQLTGTRPVLGRLFTSADDQVGAAPVVLLSYEFWARVLGGDPSVIGRTLDLNGRAYQVIGVLRPGSSFWSQRTDLFQPLGPSAGKTLDRSQHGSLRALARLKSGITLAAARTDLDSIMQRLALVDPGPESDHRAFAEYLIESRTGSLRPTLFMLMGAVGLVLLIACANVSSLLLVKNTGRLGEFAIRSAIGAGPRRLARQLLTEAATLAIFGSALGLCLAALCLRALVRWGPSGIPRLAEVRLDVPLLLFTLATALLVGLLAAVAPLRTLRNVDATVALREGSAGSGWGRQGHFFRHGLVVSEIALTLVLAFAAALLLRSLITAETANPGFDADHLLALELQLPPSSYKSENQIRDFYSRLLDTVRALPGVRSAGAVTCPVGDCGDFWYSIAGQPQPDGPMCRSLCFRRRTRISFQRCTCASRRAAASPMPTARAVRL